MNIRVTFRNMKPSEAIRNYVVKKLQKVEKFLNNAGPVEADVVLSLEKYRNIAEVVLRGKDMRIAAKEETDDIYSAIDFVVDAVEKQAKKHRERIKTKKSSFRDVLVLKEGDILKKERGEQKVVYVEEVDQKPITLEEAIMNLDSSNREFIVFNNADTGKVSVLYKREDGSYGLYEVG